MLLRPVSSLALAACLPVALVFSGCAGGPKASFTNPPPTVGIAANPTSIVAGNSSTLTVTATGATQVTVTGSDGSSYNLKPTGGTQSVKPNATTTYTATATGAGGKTAATATVTVGPAPAPTVTVTASPASISSGGSSTLTVTAKNATQVTLTGSDGSTYTLQSSGGSPSVTPATTTTYTATASGSGGKATATATVTVMPKPSPTVSIDANPTSMVAGTSSILTVAATNATQVTVTGTDGSSYTLSPTGGIQAVNPAATTTYTATATGAGGKVTASATLTVTPNPPPTVTIAANPTSIVSGSSSTLTVSTSNATAVKIAGSDGSSYTLPPGTDGQPGTSGLQSVSPTATTTYTATATGAGGTATATATVTVTPNPSPTVSIVANPATITSGNSSTLTVAATNATTVTIAGSDGSSYTLPPAGGTQAVSPTATTSYTATATGAAGTVTADTTVTLSAPGSINSINHVIFMLQENRTFDTYFGMLNPYRNGGNPSHQIWNTDENGVTTNVDGIDDKLNTISNTNDKGTVFPLFKFKTTCIDDDSSAWEESYGDVSKYDFSANRSILMNGFVHVAEGFATSCATPGASGCSGSFTDTAGQRAMGYYDQDFLNYYYYMASQFAISDRWFSPVASYSISNRIATFSGGTTQGLVRDPENTDKLSQLQIKTIFEELDDAGVSWKIYYTVTDGKCLNEDDCNGSTSHYAFPATDFSDFSYSQKYLTGMPASGVCPGTLQPSGVVGDTSNSFCIDPTHIAPLESSDSKVDTYYTDLANGTLPSFAFIEAGYGVNDEHPGSSGNILVGQVEVAKIVNALMASSSWKDSVFFLSYDEGGGPYDHVPPVPGHSNDFTNIGTLGATPPDIASISVNPDIYPPCLPPTPPGTPTTHCDLPNANQPGGHQGDAPYVTPGQNPTGKPEGFGAQLGFRVPDIVISPFARRHFVSHVPMDHTAVIKFVEERFIPGNISLTARDAAQPNLADPKTGFFDFTNPPWMTPPSPPAPFTSNSACNAGSMGP